MDLENLRDDLILELESGCSLSDARNLYIEPLRTSSWLAVSNQGVVLGLKGHLNYKLFMSKDKGGK